MGKLAMNSRASDSVKAPRFAVYPKIVKKGELCPVRRAKSIGDSGVAKTNPKFPLVWYVLKKCKLSQNSSSNSGQRCKPTPISSNKMTVGRSKLLLTASINLSKSQGLGTDIFRDSKM